MKKFIRLAFMALVLTGTVISISSCGDDDDDNAASEDNSGD